MDNLKPTRIDKDGTQYWEVNGVIHRDGDLPAVVYSDGENAWYQNGLPHRENGPAVTKPNGYEAWMKFGKLHRVDGPAVIGSKISKNKYKWFINDIELSENEFKEFVTKKLNKELENELLMNQNNKTKKIKI